MIEKRRRDRINRCLQELGKTVPMALAKQVLRAGAGRERPTDPTREPRPAGRGGLLALGAERRFTVASLPSSTSFPALRGGGVLPVRAHDGSGTRVARRRRPPHVVLLLPATPTPARAELQGGTDLTFSLSLSLAAFQSSGKLEKAEILEMTVQYLRALHSADFPRGREKGKRAASGGGGRERWEAGARPGTRLRQGSRSWRAGEEAATTTPIFRAVQRWMLAQVRWEM